MKILYLAAIRLPTEKAHGLQIVKTCEALVSAGANVELMVPGRKTHIADDTFKYYGAKKNFTLTALKTLDLVKWGGVGFLMTILSFSEAAKWKKSFWKADVIYSRDALLLLNYLLLGRNIVYEAHNSPSFVSVCVARFARKIISITEGLKQAYVEVGIPADKIIVAADAVDPLLFDRVSTVPATNGVVLYVGRIEREKGADTFAASSEFLPSHIKPVIIGEGTLKKELEGRFPRVSFRDATPYDKLPEILSEARVLVLPNSGHFLESSRNTSPLKLFAYMASGIPIVTSDVPAVREVLSEESAVFVSPDDPRALAKGIETAFEIGSEKAQKAKGLARRYSWENRAKLILSFLGSSI